VARALIFTVGAAVYSPLRFVDTIKRLVEDDYSLETRAAMKG